jgi:hypothetical protein
LERKNQGVTVVKVSKSKEAILRDLVAGRDPDSGEPLGKESVLQRATVLRAILAGADALKISKAREQRRAALPKNVGKRWTLQEDAQLRAEFQAGEERDAIASRHGRSLHSIEARLERLQLITSEERTLPRKPFLSST